MILEKTFFHLEIISKCHTKFNGTRIATKLFIIVSLTDRFVEIDYNKEFRSEFLEIVNKNM